MNLVWSIILILSIFNLILLGFNKSLKLLRRKTSKKLLLKNNIKKKLLDKISELNHALRNFDKTHVSKKEYNELVHKYNILLNEYRNLNNKNKFLKQRVKRLKEKLY